jgi:uncharacterized protein YkwD
MGRARRWIGALAVTGALALIGAGCRPPAPPPPPPSPGCGMDGISSAELGALNADRGANGLGGLAPSGQLTCLAQNWSQHMAATNSFGHQNLGAILGSPGYRNFNTLGENILEGPSGLSAGDMNNAWMNSPDHRANILSGAYRWVGIGVAYANGQMFATEDFGG